MAQVNTGIDYRDDDTRAAGADVPAGFRVDNLMRPLFREARIVWRRVQCRVAVIWLGKSHGRLIAKHLDQRQFFSGRHLPQLNVAAVKGAHVATAGCRQ